MSEIADGYEVIASEDVTMIGVRIPSVYADSQLFVSNVTLTVEGDYSKGSFIIKGKVPELLITEPLTLMLVRKTPASAGV